jgi:hypothetical protein
MILRSFSNIPTGRKEKERLLPIIPTILENSADNIGAFLLIVNFPAPKLHQKSSKRGKKKP